MLRVTASRVMMMLCGLFVNRRDRRALVVGWRPLLWMLVLVLVLRLGGRVIGVVMLALSALERRFLAGVLDIVVSDSIVARQRVCGTWIRPKRAALGGSDALTEGR